MYEFSGGRLLSDDVYDIYIVVKGAAQTNKALVCQHTGAASSGRTVFGTGSTNNNRGRTFFNNGSSFSGESSDTALDNTDPHVIRFYSAGSGTHLIQIDDGTPTTVVSGQQVTPLNTPLRLFAVGGRP